MIVKIILANFRANRQSQSFNQNFHVFFQKYLKSNSRGFLFLQLLYNFSQVKVFIACHLSTFNQKEKRGFILSKTFDFLSQKPLNFYWEKKSCSLKVAVPEFQKYRKKYLSIFATSLKNKHEHELFHWYFSVFFYFLGTSI